MDSMTLSVPASHRYSVTREWVKRAKECCRSPLQALLPHGTVRSIPGPDSADNAGH